MAVWRLYVKPAFGDISDYCLANHVAAMGWSFTELLDGSNPELEKKVQNIQTYEDFIECAEEYGYTRMSVPRLHDRVCPGDYIWMHAQGHYYLARVAETSRWRFCHEARKIDASNQLTDICWYEVGDDDSAPESFEPMFKMGPTLQRVTDPDIEVFTLWLWKALTQKQRL